MVGTIGKVLIATGLLMFGFVAYQLWGTGLEYAQAQDRLDSEFEQLLAGTPATTSHDDDDRRRTAPSTTEGTTSARRPTTVAVPRRPRPPPTTIPVPEFAEGDVMARIEIPSIGLDAKVVSGVQVADLKNGPGPLPGHADARPARQLGHRRPPHDVRPAVLPPRRGRRRATRSC